LAQLRRQFPDIDKPLGKMAFLTDGAAVFVLDRNMKNLLDVVRERLIMSIPFWKVVEEIKDQIEKLSAGKELLVAVRGQEYVLTLTPDFEDGGYTIRCPAFNANSQGETEQEAIDNMIDAIEAYLEVEEELRQEVEASQ
jgi:predicted RNase H-like HicB family nuclease